MIPQIQDTLLARLETYFASACKKAFPDLFEPIVEVTRSTQETFGHYQFNGSMKLATVLKQNPRKIAEKIVSSTQESDFIEKLEIAGPGFINIWLKVDFIAAEAQKQLQDPVLAVRATKKQKIVVDFSSPNIAKEMHVGHLRSTIIGDSLARIFEFLGHDVVRLNHVGDWGTSFGMLIAYIKENSGQVLERTDQITLSELVQFYKESKALFDADANFKKRAQLQVVALQNGEEESLRIWNVICEISRRAYQEIYNLLNIALIERGESFYNPQLAEIVADLEKKKIVTLSEGAKCIFLEGFVNREGNPLPLMIQKSDGGYNYDTTDMAAIHHRIFDEKADRIVYVTDAGQSTHFQMIFRAAELAGYLDPAKVRVDHVPFGLVLGVDGKKFRSRSGETEKLIDLLTTAVSKAEAILKERNPDWTDAERMQVAKALGVGAIKYADLSCNRVNDYAFSYERMLRFEGNTVAFVEYAYVRANGIKRKVGVDVDTLIEKEKITLTHPSEVHLALHLIRFSEVIEQILADLLPHRLTDYLYELAEKFNVFFRDCRVEGTLEQNSRLLLTEASARILHQGLLLLGVRPVERM